MGPGFQARRANWQRGNEVFLQSKAISADLWWQRWPYAPGLSPCPANTAALFSPCVMSLPNSGELCLEVRIAPLYVLAGRLHSAISLVILV